MTATYCPPPGAIDLDWSITESTRGAYLRFGGSGGFALETPEEAAAFEAAFRAAREQLERQRDARQAAAPVGVSA